VKFTFIGFYVMISYIIFLLYQSAKNFKFLDRKEINFMNIDFFSLDISILLGSVSGFFR